MWFLARVTMPSAAVIALFLLFAFAAHEAHGTRTTATVSDSKSELRNDNLQVLKLFNRWVEKHGRVYHSWGDKHRRFQIFRKNVRFIRRHNMQGNSYWMGLNKFSDLTNREFSERYVEGFRAGESLSSTTVEDFIYNEVTAEPSVDWRDSGAISDVKDQGACGSCWSFSVTGAVEAVNQIVTGEMITLSEQELMDCAHPPNQGCHGGFMRDTFQYILEHGGIRTESDYPYLTASKYHCAARNSNSTVVTIDDYQVVPSESEDSLLKAVSMNPVSVAIDSSGLAFQHYQGGVLAGHCGTDLNHAVLIVGYGTEQDGTPYWIVKNSWGTSWGEGGYVRMARLGSSDPKGMCGINVDASFPIKHATNFA